jgi:hypothetical protein
MWFYYDAETSGVEEELRETLISKLESNPFVTLQNEFGSYYKIDKHVKTSSAFKYIPPTEVKLPPNSSFQYISVIDTISAIVSDPDFKPSVPASVDGMLQDVKDGAAFRENKFFQENPSALSIMLYSDALEICNPLGARKGVHKIVNIYFTLLEINKSLRARTENFFLALMVKDADLKDNRLQVYSRLIADLKHLETHGIQLQNGTVVKAGVVAHLGDNLEAHRHKDNRQKKSVPIDKFFFGMKTRKVVE